MDDNSAAKTTAYSAVPFVLLAVTLAVLQIALTTQGRDYYLIQLNMAAYYAVVVLGLCLLIGYTGQISLGHGAFFAIGGYTSAVLTTTNIPSGMHSDWGEILQTLGVLSLREDLYGEQMLTITPWYAFLAALLLTAVIAIIIGYPALRLKGHYLAMATLGFGLIVYRILLGSDFTGSADGIQGVPDWHILPGAVVGGARDLRVENYYIAWIFAIAALAFLLNLVKSSTGRALRAIRDSEPAANAMGINTSAYKLKAFVISALLAAAAGSLLTHYNGGIGPSEAGAMKSIRYVALVAVGGMANLWGVLLISSILLFISLRGWLGSFDHAFFGIVLIIIITFAPEGPLKLLHTWRLKFKRRGPKT